MISDAKKLAGRLKDDENVADALLNETHAINKKIDAMKQVVVCDCHCQLCVVFYESFVRVFVNSFKKKLKYSMKLHVNVPTRNLSLIFSKKIVTYVKSNRRIESYAPLWRNTKPHWSI